MIVHVTASFDKCSSAVDLFSLNIYITELWCHLLLALLHIVV